MLTLSPWWCRAADADGNAAALPPLTYESLSISSLFVVVIQKWVGPPNYCTILVRHRCPPPPRRRRSSCGVAAAVVIVVMLPDHAIVIVTIFILVLLFLCIVRNPVPPSMQQR